MIELKDCFKSFTRDLDKACSPEETVARVKALMERHCEGVLAETKRVDTGRLEIPVFMSMCGPRAGRVMPTRKQMGKGASVAQAEASALMELVERFSYFSFWDDSSNFETMSWSEAVEKWGDRVVSIEKITQSVDEELEPSRAAEIMDLVEWRWHPALNVLTGEHEMVPLDWFKKLNEFNGSSAGNTFEESILQGGCELVERHVCALIDREEPVLPTLDPESFDDPVLTDLCAKFEKNGVQLVLKDFTLGMPVPTVGAVAWDPDTFPSMSEIVFTAGTAATPAKAAIRAVTEVAQLAGDFESGRVYEASGLAKYTELGRIDWLRAGELRSLHDLPGVEHENILEELMGLAQGLDELGFTLYSVDTTQKDLCVTANYNFVPGFDFRERTPHRSVGLFVGRILAEDAPELQAEIGLETIAEVYPDSYFLPFFRGLLSLRQGAFEVALDLFRESEPLQPADEERALSIFYQAYALSLDGRWQETLPLLERAIGLDDQVKEFFNLRGVARFKAGEYEVAARDFEAALGLDSGSAPDLANLGLCHKFLGNNEDALHYLEHALKLDPALEWARPHLEELQALSA